MGRTSKAKNFIVLTREEYVNDELKAYKIIRTFNWEALTLAERVTKDIAESTLLMLQQKPVRGLVLRSGLMKYVIQSVDNEKTRIEFVKNFERVES